MQPTLFGFTEAQVAEFGATAGIGLLMLFMLFIIGNLAYRANVGRTGTITLYFVLGFGMLGFVAKVVMKSMSGY